METYESLEYLIFFDYVEAQELLKDGHMKNIVIEKNIAHKYSVGMILIGNFEADDESFFTCWRRELVDNREIEKVKWNLVFNLGTATTSRINFQCE